MLMTTKMPLPSLKQCDEDRKTLGVVYDHSQAKPVERKDKIKKSRQEAFKSALADRTKPLGQLQYTETNTSDSSLDQEQCGVQAIRDEAPSKRRKENHHMIQIFIKTPIINPKNLCLRLKHNTTIFSLKQIIHRKLGIHPALQNLNTGEHQFKSCDALTLLDLGIQPETNITLSIAPGLLGGAPKRKRSVRLKRKSTAKSSVKQMGKSSVSNPDAPQPKRQAIAHTSPIAGNTGKIHSGQSSEHQSTSSDTSSVDEIMLRGLAGSIGKDWKQLATLGDFSFVEIQAFEQNNKDDLAECIFQMLITWSNKHWILKEVTDGLTKAFEKIGRIDLVKKITNVKGLSFNSEACGETLPKQLDSECPLCKKKLKEVDQHLKQFHRIKYKNIRLNLINSEGNGQPILKPLQISKDGLSPSKRLPKVAERKVKPNQLNSECPLCNKKLKEVDQHLNKFHKIKDKDIRLDLINSEGNGQPILKLLQISKDGLSPSKRLPNVAERKVKPKQLDSECPLCKKKMKRVDNHVNKVHKIKDKDIRLDLINSEGNRKPVPKTRRFPKDEPSHTLSPVVAKSKGKRGSAASTRPFKARPPQERAVKRDKSADILKPADVKVFMDETTSEANEIAGTLERGVDVNWQKVVLLRNSLMALLFLEGAPRAWVISSMTLGEFEEAETVPGSNTEPHFVVKVRDSKTECQRVTIPSAIHKLMVEYYKHGRTITFPSAPFFLAKDGSEIRTTTKDLQKLWDAKNLPGKFNPNVIRRTVATHNQRSDMPKSVKQAVSRHVARLAETQGQHYTTTEDPSSEAVRLADTIKLMLLEGTSDVPSTNQLSKNGTPSTNTAPRHRNWVSNSAFSNGQDRNLIEEFDYLPAGNETRFQRKRSGKDMVQEPSLSEPKTKKSKSGVSKMDVSKAQHMILIEESQSRK